MARVTHTATALGAMHDRLADLPRAARLVARKALDQTAEQAADAVRALYPAEPASAVTVEADPDRTGVVLVVDVPFAVAVEFGTSRVPAQPFVRPIATAAAGDAQSLLASAVRNTLRGDPP